MNSFSLSLYLLHLRTINGVISWYVLAPQHLFHFIVCVLFFSISFLFSFLFFFFWIPLLFGFEVSLSILKTKQQSCSQVSKRELLQPYLVINLPGLDQFGKNLSYILPPLAFWNCLQQSISVKLIYQFLYLTNGYLFFRCYEKVFKGERNENKKGNI